MSLIHLGLIQPLQRPEEDYYARLDQLEGLARACLDEGADLVFFPEAFQYGNDRGIVFQHEELRKRFDSWQERCASMAKEYHAYVVPWDYRVTDDGKVYNCSYILDREGKYVGEFHKVNLTYGESELKKLTHGDDFPVFDLDFGRVGIMICFDNYFPESARILGNRGAELVLYPLYGDTLQPQWELKTRVRAVDNNMYIASCQIDSNPVAFSGLFGPEGDVLAKLEMANAPSHMVVPVPVGREVITNMNNAPGECQNCREYLKKARYYPAYQGILEESPDIQTWEEIFKGKLPG